MRLAALMGRTVAELRETMDAKEWNRWLTFHSLYDLPDAFLIAGQLGALISRIVGGKGIPEDFAPYYKVDAETGNGNLPKMTGTSDLKGFYGFLSGYAKEREAAGNPIPKSR